MLQPNIGYTPYFRPMPPIPAPGPALPQVSGYPLTQQNKVSVSKCASIGAGVGALVSGLWLTIGSLLPKAEQYLWNKQPLSQLLFVGIAAFQGALGGGLAGTAIGKGINSGKI